MKYYIILILSVLLFVACSSTSQDGQTNNPDKDKYIISDQFDSTKIIAAIKPSGYPWNKEGYLTDVTRPIHQVDTTERLYPNPFSPPTQIQFKITKTDSVKFYICNTDESSCIKIEDAILDSGIYRLGFQKLEVSGMLVLKLQTTDTILTKKIIYIQ
jgi:hypothetical protein